MKKPLSRLLVAGAFLTCCACGAGDDKNKAEDYPTYDTTRKTNNINDSGSAEQHGAGSLRHNTDQPGNNNH